MSKKTRNIFIGGIIMKRIKTLLLALMISISTFSTALAVDVDKNIKPLDAKELSTMSKKAAKKEVEIYKLSRDKAIEDEINQSVKDSYLAFKQNLEETK